MSQPTFRVKLTSYGALGVMTVVSLLPLAWVWLSSLRTSAAITDDPIGLPWPPDFSAFARAWNEARFSDYLVNSVVVSGGAVLLVVATAFPAAYAFATLRLAGSTPVFILLLLGLMIPVWSIVIPLFFQLRDLGLLNTRTGAILVEGVLGLPFGVFILRAFFRELPRDLLDAARIDGAGNARIMWSIVRPLATPSLQALVVFEFMWSWNDLVVPLFFLQSDDVRTLPVGLTFFQGRFTTDTAVLFAGTTLASLPVIVAYLALNRHFIRGLTSGAIK